MDLTSLWNIKKLALPPVSTCPAPIKPVDIVILKNVFLEAKKFFENQKQFALEATCLSRSIYIMKRKFRLCKDFKAIEKLNRALLCYLDIDPLNLIVQFMSMLPASYTQNVTHLPTKNLLDYILVRLQGFGKIMCRILDTCKVTAILLRQRLILGHFWQQAISLYAMVSRIYTLTKHLTLFTCKLYLDLLPYSKKLQNDGANWLPIDYELPQNLEKWLGIDWIDLNSKIIEIPDDQQTPLFDLVIDSDDDDDDVEFCDEYVLIKDDEDETINTFKWFDDSGDEEDRGKKRKLSDGDRGPDLKRIKQEDEIIDLGAVIEETLTNKLEDVGEEIKIEKQPKQEANTSVIVLNDTVEEQRPLSKNLKRKQRKTINPDESVIVLDDTKKENATKKKNLKRKYKETLKFDESVIVLDDTKNENDLISKKPEPVIVLNDSTNDSIDFSVSSTSKKKKSPNKVKMKTKGQKRVFNSTQIDDKSFNINADFSPIPKKKRKLKRKSFVCSTPNFGLTKKRIINRASKKRKRNSKVLKKCFS